MHQSLNAGNPSDTLKIVTKMAFFFFPSKMSPITIQVTWTYNVVDSWHHDSQDSSKFTNLISFSNDNINHHLLLFLTQNSTLQIKTPPIPSSSSSLTHTLPSCCFCASPYGSSSFLMLYFFLNHLVLSSKNQPINPVNPSHTYGHSLQNSLQGMTPFLLTLHSPFLLQAMVVALPFSVMHLIDTKGSYLSIVVEVVVWGLVLSES